MPPKLPVMTGPRDADGFYPKRIGIADKHQGNELIEMWTLNLPASRSGLLMCSGARDAVAPHQARNCVRSDGVAASSHRAYDADGHPDAEAVATLVPLCPMSSVVRGVTA